MQRQKEDADAWIESGSTQPTYLSSGCIAQYEGANGTEMMAFGVGMNTDEDARVSLRVSFLTDFRSRIYEALIMVLMLSTHVLRNMFSCGHREEKETINQY